MVLNIQYFGGLYLLLEKDYDHVLIKKSFFDKLLTYDDIVLEVEEITSKNGDINYKVLFFFDGCYFKLMVRPITYNYVVTFKQTLIKDGDEFLEHSFDGLASKIKYGFNKIKKEYRFNGKSDTTDFKSVEYNLVDTNKIYDYQPKPYRISRIVEKDGIITPFIELKIKKNGKVFSNLVNFNLLKGKIPFLQHFNYSDFLFKCPLDLEEKLFIRQFVWDNISKENLVDLRIDNNTNNA